MIKNSIPKKARAVLKLHKTGPFKAGDKFEVSAMAGQLFKAERFGRIENAMSFSLHEVFVGDEGQLHSDLPMFMLTGPGAELVWPACMHPKAVKFSVEATSDAAEFSCELEGVTVLTATEMAKQDDSPVDVTL